MKILIASALFPPDIADPAPYIKELAHRLSAGHEVTILTYGAIPEEIPGVEIVAVPKHLPALSRLVRFTGKLFSLSRQADQVLLQNAPSVELPTCLVGPFRRRKLLLQMSDQKIMYGGWRKRIHLLATNLVRQTIAIDLPLPRPEIHPFKPLNPDAIKQYEQSWEHHQARLKQHLV